jgi:hypothetical protein
MDNAVMDGLSYKPKMPKGIKDQRKHGVAQTMIEHHHDGSHKITHRHAKPGVEATTHGAPDLEALHNHLEEILGGKPTAGEMKE